MVLCFFVVMPSFSHITWWRHQIETFSALLAFCAGNSPVTGEFPSQRPVTRSFDVFLDLRLNKRLSKQSWGRWFETPSRSLWRHYNDSVLIDCYWAIVGLPQCQQRNTEYQMALQTMTIDTKPFYYHGLTLNPAFESTYIHHVMPVKLLIHSQTSTVDKWFHPTLYNGCN